MPEPSVALIAILRNEIRALVEWLAHYKALGVGEMLIYDNASDDGTFEALQALEAAGELRCFPWPHSVGERPQRLAYKDARRRATAEWLCFFDADEFLLLREDASLPAFLSRFGPDVSAIAVNWVVFGSGGQESWHPRPVMERFTEALPDAAPSNRQVKSIGRRERLVGTGIHRVEPAFGHYVMPSGADAVFANLNSVRHRDVRLAALHHYALKSREEFAEKRARGHANSQDAAGKRARLDAALAEMDAGGVQNTDMRPFVPRMREEARRLQGLMAARGIAPPVWPFIETL